MSFQSIPSTSNLRTYHQHLSSHLAHLLKGVPSPLSPNSSSSKTPKAPGPPLPERTPTNISGVSSETRISSVSSAAESRRLRQEDDRNADFVTSSAALEGIADANGSRPKFTKSKSSRTSDSELDKVELLEDKVSEEDIAFPAGERTARPEFVSRSSNLISQELATSPNCSISTPAFRIQPVFVPADEIEMENTTDSASPIEAEVTTTSPTNDNDDVVVAENSSVSQDDVSESVSREEEHARAWQSDGRRVWKILPPGFQLSLDGKEKNWKRKSSDSIRPTIPTPAPCLAGTPSRSRKASGDSDVGLALGTQGGPEEATPKKYSDIIRVNDSVAINNTPQSKYTTTVSDIPFLSPTVISNTKPVLPITTAPIGPNQPLAASMLHLRLSPTPSQGPLLESQPLSTSGPSPTQVFEPCAPERHASPPSLDQMEDSVAKIPETAQDEYERRKLAKLNRHEKELRERVKTWLGGANVEQEFDETPEIYPNIPSPSLTTTLLRFEPLPFGFPPQDSSKTYNVLSSRRLNTRPRPHSNPPNPHGGSQHILGDFIRLADLASVHSKNNSENHTGVSTPPLNGREETKLGTNSGTGLGDTSNGPVTVTKVAATKPMVPVACGKGTGRRLGLGGRLTDLDVELAIRLKALEALGFENPSTFNATSRPLKQS